MLCTRCKKRQAIVFVQRMEGNETKNEAIASPVLVSCTSNLWTI